MLSSGGTALINDARGNVRQVIDSTGREIHYEFNALDQLEKEIRGSSLSTTSYDAAGNVSGHQTLAGVDASGNPAP